MQNQNVNKNEMKVCRRGHLLNSKNTYNRSDGATDCRRCAAMRKMLYRRDEQYNIDKEIKIKLGIDIN